MDYGDGNLILQSSIRCQTSRTASRGWLKTTTARSWSPRTAESDDSLMGESSHIRSQVRRGSLLPGICSAIAMVVCGSELWAAALFMFTTARQMCLRNLTVFRAKGFQTFLRIVKATFGSLLLMVLIGFANL